jgi:hypothetical protein
MRLTEIITESRSTLSEIKKGAKDSNGVTSCWKGYHAAGTKKSATTGKQVRNCVPNESVAEGGASAQQAAIAIAKQKSGKYTKDGKRKNEDVYTNQELNLLFDSLEEMFEELGIHEDNYDSFTDQDIINEATAWQAKQSKRQSVAEDGKGYKSKTGGLTKKGRDHYNRTTGSNLKAPVTTKPSKLKKGSKAANRRKSFCARMGGNKGPMKKPNGKPTRKALALRKWNC